MFNSNNSKNNKFIDCLNEILSAENAGIERLHRRIQETHIQESKNILQDHITEEKEQQQRLKIYKFEYIINYKIELQK